MAALSNVDATSQATAARESQSGEGSLAPEPPCPDALPFSPTLSQPLISNSFDSVPTYLFRLHAPRTDGTTTTAEVVPKSGYGGRTDLFHLPRDEAAGMLGAHLRWRCAGTRCSLMSWSSSLLFILQYGLHRHKKDLGAPALADIHVLVLDTRRFPRGTFLKDLPAIDEFCELSGLLEETRRWRRSDLFFGEYLTQERLEIDGQCRQTSMQELIDAGLFELCPTLKNQSEWVRWANAVRRIRHVEFSRPAEKADKKDVRIAISMAQACFGSRWALPIAAMLLSLRGRLPNDQVIMRGFESMFSGDEIEAGRETKFDSEFAQLVDVEQYRAMMTEIGKLSKKKVTSTVVVKGLSESLGKMTLGAE